MVQKDGELIKIALIEDNETDAEIFRRILQKEQTATEVTHYSDPKEALTGILGEPSLFDMVVTDYDMPGMNGLELCSELIGNKIRLPTVLLTGMGSENLAVKALKAGVDDYIVKDVSGVYFKLLPLVIKDVMEKYQNREIRIKAEEENKRLIVDLKNALADVQRLGGMLPICASCKNIRDDKGYWTQLEAFIEENSEAEFTHSICPSCRDKLYGDHEENRASRKRKTPKSK